MGRPRFIAGLSAIALLAFAARPGAAQTPARGIPHLERNGQAVQLMVNDQPFLVLGGELGNSTSSSLPYMEGVWPVLQKLNLNTVLAAVAWSQVEPEEGKFDFTVVDGLIREAGRRRMHLALLWFGSWKNGLSHYVPVWVKRDERRFPRARLATGTPEVLSPFSDANRDADARAFAALMRHLKEVDSGAHTVVMMQVENEVGLLGDSRDRSPAAESDLQLSFSPATAGPPVAGLASVEEGTFVDGRWVPGRTLNGDEVMISYDMAANAAAHRTGTGLKFMAGPTIQRVRLYRFQ